MISLKEFKEFEVNQANCIIGGVEKTTYHTAGTTNTGTDTKKCCDGKWWYEFDDGTSGWGSDCH
ncbi:MAG: hypothetical protein R2771_13360 [Saprospiraceae bacterium]